MTTDTALPGLLDAYWRAILNFERSPGGTAYCAKCSDLMNDARAAIESHVATLRPSVPADTVNPWREALIDACVINHMSWHEDDPRKTLYELICYDVQIALDPQVSSDAKALIDRGRAEALAMRSAVDGKRTDFDLTGAITEVVERSCSPAAPPADYIPGNYGMEVGATTHTPAAVVQPEPQGRHWVFAAAADLSVGAVPQEPAARSHVGRAHLCSMLKCMRTEPMSDTKANRWLGYIQGVLACNGVTLATLKAHNKVRSDAAPPTPPAQPFTVREWVEADAEKVGRYRTTLNMSMLAALKAVAPFGVAVIKNGVDHVE